MITGIVCDDTCLSYNPEDNTPTQLFGSPFTNLGGDTFTLQQDAGGWLLTINGITRQVPTNDITATATGYEYHENLINNVYGIAFEQQELCPITPPGVPEPATWALMLLGIALIGFRRYKSPR